MRIANYNQLLAIARHEGAAEMAEDIVQDALLIAVEAGRLEINRPNNARWLRGTVRNRARSVLRSHRRRLKRDSAWADMQTGDEPHSGAPPSEILKDLPPALRIFAALVLTGHNRREIAYLLRLTDQALRKRVSALKKELLRRGLSAPSELSGLNLNLNYGRIRDALVFALHRHGATFASHDPDGHLFLVQRSQNPGPRQ